MIADLPSTWSAVPLASVATIVRGVSFSGDETRSRPAPGYIPVLRAGNIAEQLITDKDLVWVPENRVSAEQRMRAGDIAICMSSGSSAIVGKTAALTKDWTGCVGAFCAIIRPNPHINAQFLASYLAGPQFKHWRLNRCQGAAIQNLRATEVERVSIPVPPPSEQSRLVDLLHGGQETLHLTEESVEKTDNLIRGIFEGMFGPPSSWSSPRLLSECVRFVGGGTPSRLVAHYFSGNIPWATSKDIKADYLDDAEEHITEDAIAKSATNLVPAGTVIIVVKSKILAHTVPLAIITRPFCFGQDLKGLIPNDGFSPEFIVASLKAQAGRILARARGVNTEGLTLEALRSLPIPQAPPDRLAVFNLAVQETKTIVSSLRRSRAVSSLLVSSLQANAFAGKLTEEWRERNADKLEQEARDRDAALDASGTKLTRAPKPADIEAIFARRTDGAYAELTRDQRAVLEAAQRGFGGVKTPRWFTSAQVATHLGGTWRKNLHSVEAALGVLAARGLVIPVSREDEQPITGEIIYGTAYRLPVETYEDVLVDEAGDRITDEKGTRILLGQSPGDKARLREMKRLSELLRKERPQ